LASSAYNTALLDAARIEVVHHSAEDGIPEDIPVHMETRKSIEPPISRLDQVEEIPAESERVSEEGILRGKRKIINWLDAVPNGTGGVAPSFESPTELRTCLEAPQGPAVDEQGFAVLKYGVPHHTGTTHAVAGQSIARGESRVFS
jgi:hypothetical protein